MPIQFSHSRVRGQVRRNEQGRPRRDLADAGLAVPGQSAFAQQPVEKTRSSHRFAGPQDAGFWKEPQIVAYLGGVGKTKMWLLDLFGDSNPICVGDVACLSSRRRTERDGSATDTVAHTRAHREQDGVVLRPPVLSLHAAELRRAAGPHG